MQSRLLNGLTKAVALGVLGLSTAWSNVILIHGPGGAASLLNDSASDAVTLAAYSISGSDLSPPGWDSLSSQGLASFNELSATSSLLSEQSPSGLLLAPGESRSIGLPFNLVLAADVDGDGAVDQNDLEVIQNNFGRTDVTGPAYGDFDYDGVVDSRDSVLLTAVFGKTVSYNFSATLESPTTVSTVPEGGSSLLLLGMALGFLQWTRRGNEAPAVTPPSPQ